MTETVFEFLKRHSSLVITTHDNVDADGVGAVITFSEIVRSMGKKVRIVISQSVPESFRFMDRDNIIECWEDVSESLGDGEGMVILDTADEYNIGKLKEYIPRAAEVMVIDHHEPNKFNSLTGYIDPTVSSTCELLVGLASEAGVTLSPASAAAAYAGIVYDSGFFAYPKTTARTFRAALTLVEAGIRPYEIYRQLNENTPTSSIVLQKLVLSTLELHNHGRVAVQILRKEDLRTSGAPFEAAEHFINFPMRGRDILVSVLVKENKEGYVRCSLRSKGNVNVSKIAQELGGGGHATAAGFKSSLNLDDTLGVVLEKISEELEKV